ncbi:PREDICTED: zinc finger SWIM domain-containing protein 7 [Miniopterus natalensis]|uniref:zinc finger SWIM domain-containing protein 7 n=1 Tax=Miniopterus natalensis TaxID=291302 RepID=UPI0007A72E70|nr:PREDICTED: zinc finger SWIM domain-containing protein 7 [Miniopterus natalensis]
MPSFKNDYERSHWGLERLTSPEGPHAARPAHDPCLPGHFTLGPPPGFSKQETGPRTDGPPHLGSLQQPDDLRLGLVRRLPGGPARSRLLLLLGPGGPREPLPDEHLLSLKFVFGSSALQALDLVDRQSITLVSSPSGRRVYQVLGSSGKTYTCLASCHYCSCPAFAFSVLRKSESLLCKHLLAVYLSQVMGTCQQLSVSDKQLTDMLLMEKKQEA